MWFQKEKRKKNHLKLKLEHKVNNFLNFRHKKKDPKVDPHSNRHYNDIDSTFGFSI